MASREYSEYIPANLANRPTGSPRVTISHNHPLIPAHAREIFKRAVIFHMSTSRAAIDAAFKAEKKLGPPKGGYEDWINEGEYWILVRSISDLMPCPSSRLCRISSWGYAILSRYNVHQEAPRRCPCRSRYRRVSIASFWWTYCSKTARSHHGTDILTELDDACGNIIGTSSDHLFGDTALEGEPQAKRVQSARCYSIGNTSEKFRRSVAPAAAGKSDGTSPSNRYQRMVAPLTRVSLPVPPHPMSY